MQYLKKSSLQCFFPVSAARSDIELISLPFKQRIRFTKSLADAYKAIGEYSQYDKYSQILFDDTRQLGSRNLDYLIGIKMRIEVSVLYQKFDHALKLMGELSG